MTKNTRQSVYCSYPTCLQSPETKELLLFRKLFKIYSCIYLLYWHTYKLAQRPDLWPLYRNKHTRTFNNIDNNQGFKIKLHINLSEILFLKCLQILVQLTFPTIWWFVWQVSTSLWTFNCPIVSDEPSPINKSRLSPSKLLSNIICTEISGHEKDKLKYANLLVIFILLHEP